MQRPRRSLSGHTHCSPFSSPALYFLLFFNDSRVTKTSCSSCCSLPSRIPLCVCEAAAATHTSKHEHSQTHTRRGWRRTRQHLGVGLAALTGRQWGDLLRPPQFVCTSWWRTKRVQARPRVLLDSERKKELLEVIGVDEDLVLQ